MFRYYVNSVPTGVKHSGQWNLVMRNLKIIMRSFKKHFLILIVIFISSTLLHSLYGVSGSHRNEPLYRLNWTSELFAPENETSFGIVGDHFVLKGKPLQIRSGSFHYFRTPSEHWRDILQKMKAAGLNAVSTYVEWSYHEPEERVYKFTDDRDVAKFVRMAAEEGLLVLLRPGPYICAERDLGGLPYWLLGKYPRIKLRSSDKDFMREVRIWFDKLFENLRPLLHGNGGPIVLVQVENEYGLYEHAHDIAYMEQLRDMMLKHVGRKALLYTTDPPRAEPLQGGAVSGALATADFGTVDDVKITFQPLRQIQPKGPLMNSEFYTGWITHWGENFSRVPNIRVVSNLHKLLEANVNFNFYVFFGGTNFEFTSGANLDGTYKPSITSYDYDAPLNEAGDPTSKYYAISEELSKYNGKLTSHKNELPVAKPKGKYGKIKLHYYLSLFSAGGRDQVGKPYDDVDGGSLPTFEYLRQRAGLMLYETTLYETTGTLMISKPRDWIYVYVDGELRETLSRMKYKNFPLKIACNNGSKLSLLVENQGRINYGNGIHDFKGILSYVRFNTKILQTWKVTGYPLEVWNLKYRDHRKNNRHGPVLYQGCLTLPDQQKLDTWIDIRGWGRGYVWVNGHNLGRYWPAAGPQRTLYVPGAWLRAPPHDNLVQVLELERAHPDLTLEFIDFQILS